MAAGREGEAQEGGACHQGLLVRRAGLHGGAPATVKRHFGKCCSGMSVSLSLVLVQSASAASHRACAYVLRCGREKAFPYTVRDDS